MIHLQGFLLSLLLCCACLPSTQALLVPDLYVAEVLVTSTAASELKSGTKAGLLQVLVKVSGKVDVGTNSLIRDALLEPVIFLSQYGYESTNSMLFLDDRHVPAQLLTLHFDPGAVIRLLRQAQLPIWGVHRPSLLVWVAVSDATGRELLLEDTAHTVLPSLINQAKLRGLPLLFPLMDLEDRSQISIAEIWGAFLDRVDRASVRYSPNAILTGRLQQDSTGKWHSRWSYRSTTDWQTVVSSSFSADELFRDVLNQLADELAARYALGSSRGEIALSVEGVTNLTTYADLTRYLQSLAPVSQSSLVALEEDRVEFELQTEGQYEQLMEIIKLDGRLVLLNQEPLSSRLLYRWTH